jgi:5-methyltetrahydropteroyltriglutamate--homocysteine methyltransferase
MKQSSERIIVSHAGALPAPPGFEVPVTEAAADAKYEDILAKGVRDVVQTQVELGVDSVNDGELSKRSGGGGGFTYYAMQRLSHLEHRDFSPESSPARTRDITGRDARDFPGFASRQQATSVIGQATRPVVMCIGPLEYIGGDALARDVKNLSDAIEPYGVEGFLPAVAPGTVEHWLFNAHYANDEGFLFAIADALHDEYRAITDAGLVLQIDDPDLPDGWQMFPDMAVEDYRSYARLRVDALNHALRDCPPELIRFHVCWGSGHGPHVNDIPLDDIVDLVLSVRAGCVSIEAANTRHDHEWRTWEHAHLPDGVSLMPGVVGHSSDIVEHPRLIADRLVRWAGLVGKENVIAGTDCGLGTRVAHGEIAWAKLAALVEGARLASAELWS